ncbi:(2,3-dihydroxybenzoyl)adenylate synthase [Pseudonocardia sp. WMMC193]|uniref:(2,3-dihydroxybenzoyl)adenylate synthase n=1 Tax=Pseudonocardia sp. WMMC193 TaxID=2911965 RepID=UPI001F484AC9|nr:AMP-binding protein [Pseudonocardia sp. WMMC193]MCF7549504.1 AMP-binding protein [Pseudonocardia sp. WMMC193]
MTDPGFTPWPAEFVERYVEAGYWGSETLGGLLRGWAARSPGDVALVCGPRRLTYAELDAAADAMAAGFGARGFGPGDHVVVQLPNVAEFVVALFALLRLGAIPVLTMPAHRRAEIVHVAQVSEAVACLVPDRHEGFDHVALAEQVRREVPSVRSVFVRGEPGASVSSVSFGGFEDLADVPVPGARVDDAASAEDVALLLMSGGTTGRPKLIPRTHRDYAYNLRAAAQVCGLTERDVYLAVLPIGHNLPLACPGVLGTLSAGGTAVLAPAPSPDVAFGLVERERVTVSSVVPPLARLWVEAAPQDGRDLSSLDRLMVGGARLDVGTADRVQEVLGVRLIQSLGMAEGLLTQTRPEDPPEIVRSTQGRPMSPADEIRVLDEAGRPVPAGEVGELWTRGPYTLRGYYRAAEYNRLAFDDEGFYRTGDLVRVLPGGHVVVAGRVKEVINRGGENVSATELEEELLGHPAVAAAAVFPLLDDDLGETVCAAVVLRPATPRPPKLKELKAYLRERGLARFKHPDRLLLVDTLPLTGVGKVDKKALAQSAARV